MTKRVKSYKRGNKHVSGYKRQRLTPWQRFIAKVSAFLRNLFFIAGLAFFGFLAYIAIISK